MNCKLHEHPNDELDARCSAYKVMVNLRLDDWMQSVDQSLSNLMKRVDEKK